MDKFSDKINAEMAETQRLLDKIKRIEKGEKVKDGTNTEKLPKFFSDLLNGTPFSDMGKNEK